MAEQRGMDALTLLMQLERSARHAEDLDALRFQLVNETRRLIAYRQAALIRLEEGGAARLEAVSGVAKVERDAPFAQWLERLARRHAVTEAGRTLHEVDPAALGDAERRDWKEFGAAHVIWCPLDAPGGERLGVLWLARETPWGEGERVLVERLADAYAHAWWALLARRRKPLLPKGVRRWRWAAAAVVAVALALPVSQSALAPAEVVARDPLVVAAPLQGVVAEILVEPNQEVKAGEALLRFEDVALRSDHEVAEKALSVAEAELRTARQGAFSDPRSKARLAQLESQVKLRAAERDYARALLDRVTVRAERDGVAIFSDPNDWRGRPVAVGERIMELADPARVELRAMLPVEDAIVLHRGAEVRLFLDSDPLAPLDAALTHASYEAQVTPSGVLAYRATAAFTDGASPRIGLQGTAKLYGERVSLFFYLFRRPISAARRWLGW